jgi:hypothetical protein
MEGDMDNPTIPFPDLYADALSVASGPYGVTITLYLTEPPRSGSPQRARIVGRVRLSPELAEGLSSSMPNRTQSGESVELGS